MNRLCIFIIGSLTAASMLAQSVATQLPLSGRGNSNASVNVAESAIPGTTTSVNTINTSIQVSGAYAGSASSASKPFSGSLSLNEAIQRALQFNLGAVQMNQAVRQAVGQSRVARGALLPNLSSSLSETVQQLDLQAEGIRVTLPIKGFAFPTIVGPYNYFDLRARLTQTVADMTAINNFRAAKETAKADELTMKDARDLVVMAVGGAYLEVIAAKARIDAAQAQLKTADAQFKQAKEQREAGVLALTDLNRAEIQVLTIRERILSLENDYAKQKINLARITGLPTNEHFELSNEIPFSPAPALELDAAIKQALAQRADMQTAEAEIHAAEFARSAARSERLPSLSLAADYGVVGLNPSDAHGTFSVTGTLRVPIWLGGRTEGDIQQADAVLAQRKAELEDLRSHIESDVRSAFLDLQAAAGQVEVASRNREITHQTLELTRQRYQAGVTDIVEVTQAQETVASAELDYINSVFAHNVGKLSLARALGNAAEKLPTFFNVASR